MKEIAYAGSFDPITYGHQDIIERSVKMFGKIIICVSNNDEKKYLFNLDERFELVKKTYEDMDEIKIIKYNGHLLHFIEEYNVGTIIKGVRNTIDFQYELDLYNITNTLNNKIDTVFIPARKNLSFISSTIVKNIAKYKGDTSKFVNKYVNEKLLNEVK